MKLLFDHENWGLISIDTDDEEAARYVFVDSNASAKLADDGKHVEFTHVCVFGATLTGALPLGDDGWAVVTKIPLTVEPSVQCDRCKWHGWIINGECVR